MAIVKYGTITQSWFMSNTNPESETNKVASISHNVAAGDITAYNAAADDAARLATDIGVFFAAEAALSLGVVSKRSVGFEYKDDAVIPPTANEFVYPFDKFTVSFRADGENYKSSIPARDNADVVMSGNGTTVDLGAGASAETLAYVAAFNSTVLSEELAAVIITRITVNK